MIFGRLFRLPFAGIHSIWLAVFRSTWWRQLAAFLRWPHEAVPKPEGDLLQIETHPRSYPKVIRYLYVAGDWERALHPDWPESKFQVPTEVPYGTIYHVRKGAYVGFGMTAITELTPEGYVVKTPRPDPYDPCNEEESRGYMRIEAEVYRRLGPDCPYVPKMIAWDPETCSLSLEYMPNESLLLYTMKQTEENASIEPALRRRWAVQITRGLCALHAVNVIHSDFTPRNILLDAELNAYVCDFAGSCIDGAQYNVCSGERYLVPGWSFEKTPEPTDDLFSLGCLLYFILAGKKPHATISDHDEISKLYEAGQFPDVAGIEAGETIQGCWTCSFKSADEVLERLLIVFSDVDNF